MLTNEGKPGRCRAFFLLCILPVVHTSDIMKSTLHELLYGKNKFRFLAEMGILYIAFPLIVMLDILPIPLMLVLLLTFVAGILFAWRYERSKSLAVSIVEHSLYGVWLFACGLGYFFVSSFVE